MAESLTCDAIVDGDLIERYLAGTLSEAEVEALESHYLTCARCQDELRLAAAIREVLPELRETAQAPDVCPAAVTGRWYGRRAGLGAVAAAVAAVLRSPGRDAAAAVGRGVASLSRGANRVSRAPTSAARSTVSGAASSGR